MEISKSLSYISMLAKKQNLATPYICGGTPRDKVRGEPLDISDIDITNGEKSIHLLGRSFAMVMNNRKESITYKVMDDGHSSVTAGNIKFDFSSNFLIPGIEDILIKQGIKNPTEMEKELFSRDFTCNTLLMSLDLKKIYDLTGFGVKDIKEKIIKTCLAPEITLKYNQKRIIRIVYLACKLDFTVDPLIINWCKQFGAEYLSQVDKGYLTKTVNKALLADKEKAVKLIGELNLWNSIPVTDNILPYLKANNLLK